MFVMFTQSSKTVIPKNFNSLNLEYVAKYNEGKFSSDKQKAAAFKKLFEVIHDNELLLSTAIYTKQLVLIKEIIQKIPIEKLVEKLVLKIQ